jgi:hypothetical protein
MKIDWRSWHAWLSVILSLPVFLVGLTAVLIAHHKVLGLDAIPVEVGWLRDGRNAAPEIKASLVAADGKQYLGTKGGLFVLDGSQALVVKVLVGSEVRSLTESGAMILAGGSRGVWLKDGDIWRCIHAGAVHSVQASAGGDIYVATPLEGLLVSRDGGNSWTPDRSAADALARLSLASSREDYSLGKLVMDVHNGKAFFGKRWDWLWIDGLGLLMVFLSLTGVYLWWKGQKRRMGIG